MAQHISQWYANTLREFFINLILGFSILILSSIMITQRGTGIKDFAMRLEEKVNSFEICQTPLARLSPSKNDRHQFSYYMPQVKKVI